MFWSVSTQSGSQWPYGWHQWHQFCWLDLEFLMQEAFLLTTVAGSLSSNPSVIASPLHSQTHGPKVQMFSQHFKDQSTAEKQRWSKAEKRWLESDWGKKEKKNIADKAQKPRLLCWKHSKLWPQDHLCQPKTVFTLGIAYCFVRVGIDIRSTCTFFFFFFKEALNCYGQGTVRFPSCCHLKFILGFIMKCMILNVASNLVCLSSSLAFPKASPNHHTPSHTALTVPENG